MTARTFPSHRGEQPSADSEAITTHAQHALASVHAFLSPATAAEIQERIWEWRDRLEEISRRIELPPVPIVARPRRLPRPLNPLYFERKRQGRSTS